MSTENIKYPIIFNIVPADGPIKVFKNVKFYRMELYENYMKLSSNTFSEIKDDVLGWSEKKEVVDLKILKSSFTGIARFTESDESNQRVSYGVTIYEGAENWDIHLKFEKDSIDLQELFFNWLLN